MGYPSPDLLAQLLDSVPGVVWEARGRPDAPDQVIDYVSAGVERMLGYTVDEWLATPNFWLTIVHPEDYQRAMEKAAQDFTNGGGINRFRWLTKDGRALWVEAHATVIYDAQGMPAGMRGVTLDISDRVRRDETQRYLIDAGKILASTLDYEATLRNLANLTVPFFADWFAVDLLASDGKSVALAVVNHRDPAKIELARELRQRFPIDLDDPRLAPHPLKSGEPEFYPVITDDVLQAFIDNAELLTIMRGLGLTSAINVPLVARDRAFGSISFIMGESGRRYDELDLQTAIKLASRASLAIDNANLFHAAEAAVRQRQDILSIVSHDLKNPLAAIQGSAQFLERKIAGNPELKQPLEWITKAVTRAVALIDDLNLVSKIESGGGVGLSKESLPLKDLIDDLEAVFMPVAADRGLKLTIGHTAKEQRISVDGKRLFQALSNVVANALKFGPLGSEVRIEAGIYDTTFRCAISDEGPGIPAHHVEDIFKKNWQGKPAPHLGTGLGLYVSRAIVEAHGGSICVHSEPGHGTTFRIEIPAAALSVETQPA